MDREATRGEVDVLRLDYQGSAIALLAPVLSGVEQRRSDPGGTSLRTNAVVPENGDVWASFKHVKARRVEGDHCTSNPLAGVIRRK